MPPSAKTEAKPVILSSNPLADAFVPYPLFPPFVLLDDHQDLLQPLNNAVRARLDTLDPSLKVYGTWRLGIDFLAKQCQLPEFTARHYKILCPVIEAMMHWSWSIQCKPLSEWQETDAREFMSFVMRPPMTWISQTGGTRYVLRHKTEAADNTDESRNLRVDFRAWNRSAPEHFPEPRAGVFRIHPGQPL